MSKQTQKDLRGPKLSRVVLAYHPQNFDRAVANFTAALGVTFETLDTAHLGLRVAMAFEAGMEIVSPINAQGFGPAMLAEITRNGEGFQQFILEVPDLDEADATARSRGWDSEGVRVDCFNAEPLWRERFSRMEEAPLPPIDGVSVTLIQMVPHG